MKVYVAWVSYDKSTPSRGFWDQQMLEDAFSRQMWNPVNGHEFEHITGISDVPRNAEGVVVVLHARSCAHERWAHKLNDELQRFKWAIVALVSDEESSFPAFQIKHPNMKLWIMMPNERKHQMKHFGLPNGYPTDALMYLKKFQDEQIKKPLDWFFSGQDTHQRRHVFVEYAQAIGGMPGPEFGTGGVLIKTDGFTKGLPREEYYRLMAMAKVVPCPSGTVAPDSFRVYEALEAGCVPLADNYYAWEDFTTTKSYWKFLFQEIPPFPTVDEWRHFPKLLLDTLADWPANANRIGAWWIGYKRKFVYKLEEDINVLRWKDADKGSTMKDKITVLISSSVIPSHPSPRIIQETIASIRTHLPESEIIIMQDGLRPEQSNRRADYEEYKRQLLHIIRNEYHNVLPIFFEEFLHQAEMTRRTLEHVRTPYLLFVEHDTPLCEDKKIEWDGIIRALDSGWCESIRLHHMDCEFIHPEHMSLAIDKCRQDVCGIQLVRTRQYSQRPHVASADFYRRLLSNFSPNCRTFIEDRVYELFYSEKVPFKLAIYAPEGHIKRSRDLNGREGTEKFADRLVF